MKDLNSSNNFDIVKALFSETKEEFFRPLGIGACRIAYLFIDHGEMKVLKYEYVPAMISGNISDNILKDIDELDWGASDVYLNSNKSGELDGSVLTHYNSGQNKVELNMIEMLLNDGYFSDLINYPKMYSGKELIPLGISISSYHKSISSSLIDAGLSMHENLSEIEDVESYQESLEILKSTGVDEITLSGIIRLGLDDIDETYSHCLELSDFDESMKASFVEYQSDLHMDNLSYSNENGFTIIDLGI